MYKRQAEKGDSGCAPTVSGQKENGKNTPGGSKQQSGSDGTFPAFSESVKQKGKQYGKKKHREKGACQVADFPGPGKMTETDVYKRQILMFSLARQEVM